MCIFAVWGELRKQKRSTRPKQYRWMLHKMNKVCNDKSFPQRLCVGQSPSWFVSVPIQEVVSKSRKSYPFDRSPNRNGIETRRCYAWTFCYQQAGWNNFENLELEIENSLFSIGRTIKRSLDSERNVLSASFPSSSVQRRANFSFAPFFTKETDLRSG